MVDLAIIADDLTGALDAAAPFAMRGLPTVVALSPMAVPAAIGDGARIIGISTDSREISPEAARQKVAETLAFLPPGTKLFKKVDSRLKGNVEAELDAIRYERSLVAPAIPAFGRLSRAGFIEGFGVDVPIDMANRLGTHASKAALPDIADQSDFAAALALPHDLPVGARSLAEAIAENMVRSVPSADIKFGDVPVYCVIGSTDPITLSQIEALRKAASHATYIAAPNGAGSQPRHKTSLTIVQAVEGPGSATGSEVAGALADTLWRLSPPPGSLLVLSGGATAQIILERLGIDRLQVLGEALPGLPIALANGLTVITKSGGFGEPGTLARLLAPYFSVGSPERDHVG